MKNLIIIFFISIALIGCKKESETKQIIGKGEIELELLFEHDGCKVYRFNDGIRHIYYSDCRGNIEYDYTTRSGKSSSTHKQQTLNN